MPLLQNWGIVRSAQNPYLPPEMAPYSLSGNVFGHPSVEDGTFVTTSAIESVDELVGGIVVFHCRSRKYFARILDVSPDFLLVLAERDMTITDSINYLRGEPSSQVA